MSERLATPEIACNKQAYIPEFLSGETRRDIVWGSSKALRTAHWKAPGRSSPGTSVRAWGGEGCVTERLRIVWLGLIFSGNSAWYGHFVTRRHERFHLLSHECYRSSGGCAVSAP